MVEYVKKNGLDVSYSDVFTAFDIAEAMLAEQEKRTDKTRPDVLVSDEHKKESVHLNNLG